MHAHGKAQIVSGKERPRETVWRMGHSAVTWTYSFVSTNMEVPLIGRRNESQVAYSRRLDSEVEISMYLLRNVQWIKLNG